MKYWITFALAAACLVALGDDRRKTPSTRSSDAADSQPMFSKNLGTAGAKIQIIAGAFLRPADFEGAFAKGDAPKNEAVFDVRAVLKSPTAGPLELWATAFRVPLGQIPAQNAYCLDCDLVDGQFIAVFARGEDLFLYFKTSGDTGEEWLEKSGEVFLQPSDWSVTQSLVHLDPTVVQAHVEHLETGLWRVRLKEKVGDSEKQTVFVQAKDSWEFAVETH